jgi:hypothetical protein
MSDIQLRQGLITLQASWKLTGDTLLLHTKIRAVGYLMLYSRGWTRARGSSLIELRAKIERISARTDVGSRDRSSSVGCSLCL